MYTMRDETYLVLELFNGYNYVEENVSDSTIGDSSYAVPRFYRSNFKVQKLMLSLDSFKLTRTQKERFTHYYRTKNIHQLTTDVRNIQKKIRASRRSLQEEALQHLLHFDSLRTATTPPRSVVLPVEPNILQFKDYADQYCQHKTQSKEQKNTDLLIAPTTLYNATDLAPIYSLSLIHI